MDSIILVSGLPRSGTSLTMKMLAKTNLSIAKDEKRPADSDNPEGYFEIDDIINKLRDNPEFILQFKNQIVKVTAYGLLFLPKPQKNLEYKIVYIERNIHEVLASMRKMMERRGTFDEKTYKPEEIKKTFHELNEKTKAFIQSRKDCRILFVDYNKFLSEPLPLIHKLVDFLKIDSSKKDLMLSAINPELYRNKIK